MHSRSTIHGNYQFQTCNSCRCNQILFNLPIALSFFEFFGLLIRFSLTSKIDGWDHITHKA
jgi:hypothetical protein